MLSPTFKPYTIYDDGQKRSFCRGVDKTAGNISTRFDSISSYWVDTITSPYDQDISALFVGPKGSGKSSAVLSICYAAANKIADWRNDGSTWDDYYNLEELTACIIEEEATRLMNIQRKYIIKNFDDIGIGWGARNWRDDENIQKNDIFQINRTDNALQIFSLPNQFLLDKVPRSLVSHYVEMDEQIFDKGYTTIKLFKPRTMFREGKIINPFLMVDRNKFVNYLIPAPPHDLWTQYKKLRQKNKDIAIRRRQDQKVKSDERKALEEELRMKKLQREAMKEQQSKEKVAKEGRWDDLHGKWDALFVELTPEIVGMAHDTGKTFDKCMALVIRRRGISDRALAYYRREGFIEKFKLKDILVV